MTYPDPIVQRAPESDAMLELVRAGEWRTLAQLGRFGLAAQAMRGTEGVDADTDAFEALAALAEVEASVRTKAVGRAQQRFDRLQVRPADLVDWDGVRHDLEALARAVAAVDRRELPEARAALDELRTDAFAAERHALLGTMSVLEGDSEAGAASFEAALARDPQHVRAWTNRGNVKLEAGDVDGAIADYERAIGLDEGFANAHHNLGVAYRRKGQVGKSVAALRKAQRHASRRDAEEARATVRARTGGRAASGAPRRPYLRWALIVVAVGAAYWWWQGRGTI